MKPVSKYILISLVCSASLAMPILAKAAPANFTLKNGNEDIVLSKATLSAWEGSFSVPAGTNLTLTFPSVENLFNSYLGLPLKNSSPQITHYTYSPAKAYDYINKLSAQVNQTSSEPSLKIEKGEVIEFTPPLQGKNLDAYNSTLLLLKALQSNQAQAELKIETINPKKDLGKTNDLGINELIAHGYSNFAGSPKNRRHNIKVGTETMRGIIVKPGEEFSFNKYLGPVEAEQGYLPELVIKGQGEGTVPELGGGLCQVSSTVFRAAMEAGLPITQRRNHAYAVKYYAPQGTDATIYPGVIDLKFINDTPASILIWPTLKDDYLSFDFYGTKDDRKVALSTPVQFDKKADGSMKATWERSVTKDGKTKTDVFKSTYQPPALFHKEEKFIPAVPPTPTTEPGQTPPTENPAPETTTPQTPAPTTN